MCLARKLFRSRVTPRRTVVLSFGRPCPFRNQYRRERTQIAGERGQRRADFNVTTCGRIRLCLGRADSKHAFFERGLDAEVHGFLLQPVGESRRRTKDRVVGGDCSKNLAGFALDRVRGEKTALACGSDYFGSPRIHLRLSRRRPVASLACISQRVGNRNLWGLSEEQAPKHLESETALRDELWTKRN